jgi:hypothetical protein
MLRKWVFPWSEKQNTIHFLVIFIHTQNVVSTFDFLIISFTNRIYVRLNVYDYTYFVIVAFYLRFTKTLNDTNIYFANLEHFSWSIW